MQKLRTVPPKNFVRHKTKHGMTRTQYKKFYRKVRNQGR